MPAERSDEELATRAARGDASAFETLVLRYQRPLINFAYRMLGDADDAADVAQQTLVQAYVHLPRARLDLPFRPWLYRIARNRCIDRLRERRAIALPDDAEDDASAVAEIPDPDPLPDELLEREDLQRLLAAAIGELPERYRAVVTMRYVTDLTFAEIGQSLGIPENTVKTFFQRAKAKLRHRLRDAL
ncbi:MAG TPA: sigma-70 family RNA polymerase sigma factor [Chloroflexota bacterium]|nr:sigma-70 family RNA polymerase sigma factor [Chloroflexota bacterium]